MSTLIEMADVDVHAVIERPRLVTLLGRALASTDARLKIHGALFDTDESVWARVLEVEGEEDVASYRVALGWPDSFAESYHLPEMNRLRDTLLRAGQLEHDNIGSVIDRLAMYDDVIVGVDTNVLLDCSLTGQLIPAIAQRQYPDWLLFAVPKMVTAEIENKANNTINQADHLRAYWPSYSGRLANRALQEIMDINMKDPSRPGMSLMTVGEFSISTAEMASQGNWLKDAEIRRQFQSFLNQINFHKGTYFCSADRVNAMMSGTEGADGLYLQKPELDTAHAATVSTDTFARVIYELAVHFGEVAIVEDEDTLLQLSINWPGKHVADWQGARLRIESPP